MHPLLQHGLDEDMELVAALVLCSIDPLVIPLAVLQAGRYYFLGLVDIIQVPGLVHPRQSEMRVLLQL